MSAPIVTATPRASHAFNVSMNHLTPRTVMFSQFMSSGSGANESRSRLPPSLGGPKQPHDAYSKNTSMKLRRWSANTFPACFS